MNQIYKTVRPHITDLIVMGRVTSDLAAVKKLGTTGDMIIERRIPEGAQQDMVA